VVVSRGRLRQEPLGLVGHVDRLAGVDANRDAGRLNARGSGGWRHLALGEYLDCQPEIRPSRRHRGVEAFAAVAVRDLTPRASADGVVTERSEAT
jgi:hypothetical protein